MKPRRYQALGPLLSGGEGSRAFLGLEISGDEVCPVAMVWVPEAIANQPALAEKVRRDTERAASLLHPNILRVSGIAETEGFMARVVEFANGESLRRVLEAGGPLPVPLAARVVAEAALGTHHAHTSETTGPWVHGDLRPETLFLSYAGVTKISGYGALDVAPKEMGGKRVVGRRLYSAPEQLLGGRDASNVQTDVFLLGLLLWETLTGLRPFADAPNPDRATIEDPLQLIGIPEPLHRVLAIATAKKAAARYPSALALCEAIEDAVGPAASDEDLSAHLESVFGDDASRAARLKLISTGIADLEKRLGRPLTVPAPRKMSRPPRPLAAAAAAPMPTPSGAALAARDSPEPGAIPGRAREQSSAPASGIGVAPSELLEPVAATASVPVDQPAFTPADAALAPAIAARVEVGAPAPVLPAITGPVAVTASVTASLPVTPAVAAPVTAPVTAPVPGMPAITAPVAVTAAPAAPASIAPAVVSGPTSPTAVPAPLAQPAAAPTTMPVTSAQARTAPAPAPAAATRDEGPGLVARVIRHRATPVITGLLLVATSVAIVLFGGRAARVQSVESGTATPAPAATPDSASAAVVPPLAVAEQPPPEIRTAPKGKARPASWRPSPKTSRPTKTTPRSAPPEEDEEPSVARAAPAATEGEGAPMLSVEVDPPVSVFVNGKRAGLAPISMPIKAGTHQLRLVDKALGIDLRRSIKVGRKGTTQVEIEIGKAAVAVDGPGGAAVFMDGKQVGTLPLTRDIEVYEGQHVIRVDMGGASWKQPFKLDEGDRMHFQVELEARELEEE